MTAWMILPAVAMVALFALFALMMQVMKNADYDQVSYALVSILFLLVLAAIFCVSQIFFR